MATKKSIAEQALRVIQGGNISDDSDIDIREKILFVEQERDALINIFELVDLGVIACDIIFVVRDCNIL